MTRAAVEMARFLADAFFLKDGAPCMTQNRRNAGHVSTAFCSFCTYAVPSELAR